jgi:hypothetical protein
MKDIMTLPIPEVNLEKSQFIEKIPFFEIAPTF